MVLCVLVCMILRLPANSTWLWARIDDLFIYFI